MQAQGQAQGWEGGSLLPLWCNQSNPFHLAVVINNAEFEQQEGCWQRSNARSRLYPANYPMD